MLVCTSLYTPEWVRLIESGSTKNTGVCHSRRSVFGAAPATAMDSLVSFVTFLYPDGTL